MAKLLQSRHRRRRAGSLGLSALTTNTLVPSARFVPPLRQDLFDKTAIGGSVSFDPAPTIKREKEMTRAEATHRILAAKKQKGLTFEAIAAAVGRHKVWTTAALSGQATMSPRKPRRPVPCWDWGLTSLRPCRRSRLRDHWIRPVPVDPLIYRFHEITQVYGTTLKAIIHEMFGDGIMSAIDFELDVQKRKTRKVTASWSQ